MKLPWVSRAKYERAVELAKFDRETCRELGNHLRVAMLEVSRLEERERLREQERAKRAASRRAQRAAKKQNAAKRDAVTLARITGLENPDTTTGTIVGWPPYIQPS